MSSIIQSKPDILNGKPCVAGTRLSVEFLLELFAGGADRAAILEAYPQLSDAALTAVLNYAAHSLKTEVQWERKVSA